MYNCVFSSLSIYIIYLSLSIYIYGWWQTLWPLPAGIAKLVTVSPNLAQAQLVNQHCTHLHLTNISTTKLKCDDSGVHVSVKTKTLDHIL